MAREFDVAIVGAGIVGLAHAREAVRRGLRVALFETHAQCVGASVRNFGYVTISGQRPGKTRERALHSRQVWLELAGLAGFPVCHEGSWVLCRTPEAAAVAAQFTAGPEGEGCEFKSPGEFGGLLARHPQLSALRLDEAAGLLYSPHELRVQSPLALAAITRWLEQQGVDMHFCCTVTGLDGNAVHTSHGKWQARRIVLCTGESIHGLGAAAWRGVGLQLCTLQMLRIEPCAGFRLPGSVLTDESLARYPGWSNQPSAAALKSRLDREQPARQAQGVHLIAVQDADGCIVLGDSHHYGPCERVGSRQDVDQMILDLANCVLNIPGLRIRDRWTGVYPVATADDAILRALDEHVVAVLVTSGTGASTAFGIARDCFDLYPVAKA